MCVFNKHVMQQVLTMCNRYRAMEPCSIKNMEQSQEFSEGSAEVWAR